jgi:Cyclic nucleotide-binding domain
MSAEPPALPRALDDDDDDVGWALQTAGVQWERGGTDDAIVWLKRAAESAAEAGKFVRSAEIQRRANEIDRWLKQSVTFPIQSDDDDGVDALLAADPPDIEAGTLSEASASLVDALEAEARDDGGVFADEGAPVRDLGDVEDVEDIEAVDLDEFEEERKLDGYREELLDETTHARSEVARAILIAPEPVGLEPTLPPASTRPLGGRPSSERPSDRVRTQAPSSRSGKAPERTVVSAPPPKPARVSSRPASSPAREVRRSRQATPQVPPPAEYNLPPPPIPRLPLPQPKPSTRALPEVSEPRSPFPSEPVTLPASERPVLPAISEGPRERVESLPEVSVTEIELPEREAPTSTYTFGAPDEATTAATSKIRSTLEPRAASVPPRGARRERPVSSAAPAELDAAVDALSETPPPPPALDVALLAACRGLEDLPAETQAELALRARLETLAPDQEVSDFGLALVTQGHVVVMPTIAEGACGYAGRGEPVFSRGTLSEGVPLRAVALAEGAEVAVWRPEDFERVLETCPWVADELRAVADRFQALAGAAMGPLGDRLDDNMRSMLTDRCEVRVLLAGEVLIEEGKTPGGLFIVGGGRLEMVSGGAVVQELGPGDLPFASSVLTHGKATATVRAAAAGALILHADRMATHELIVSVPPLLELLSMV